MSYLLVVDDIEAIRLVVRKILTDAGYEVQLVPGGQAALEAIEAREPELVVLDLSMPGMSGLEVCRTIKGSPFTEGIPVLMLTAQSDIDQKIEGFDAGADDYLAKPFEPRELLARVTALLRLVRREGDRNPSSGLPGGRAIREEIERRLAGDEPFALCYLDLDNFKPFADTFGFTIADQVISDTGAAIRRAVETAGGPQDFAGHIGGDDFLVVTTPACAEPIARECAADFEAVVARAVGPATMAQGTFHGCDRDGAEQEYPLAQLAAAVLIVDPAQHPGVGHLGSFAAELKRRAKAQGPGTVLVQRWEESDSG